MAKKGIVMGARMSGKIKTVAYIVAVCAALLCASLQRLALLEFLFSYFRTAAVIIFGISAALSIFSFFDYLLVFKKSS
jgi:phosphatidylglycerophosphate synthase